MIVLMQLRNSMPAYGLIHLHFFSEKIASVACFLRHKPDELRQIAVDILRTFDQVGPQYYKVVLDVQGQFSPESPVIAAETRQSSGLAESDHVDAGSDHLEDDEVYEYSDQESDEFSTDNEATSDAGENEQVLLPNPEDDLFVKKQRLE